MTRFSSHGDNTTMATTATCSCLYGTTWRLQMSGSSCRDMNADQFEKYGGGMQWLRVALVA